jgi:hypothetical protein
MPDALDPLTLLRQLHEHGVEHTIIGGLRSPLTGSQDLEDLRHLEPTEGARPNPDSG